MSLVEISSLVYTYRSMVEVDSTISVILGVIDLIKRVCHTAGSCVLAQVHVEQSLRRISPKPIQSLCKRVLTLKSMRLGHTL